MRLLSQVPRGRRRAGPAASQAVKRAATPKSTNRVRRAIRRLRKAALGMTRSRNRNSRSAKGKPVAVYRHGTCTVNHRSRKTASKCRRTY